MLNKNLLEIKYKIKYLLRIINNPFILTLESEMLKTKHI